MVVGGDKERWASQKGLTTDTWIFPIGSKFNNSPPPYPWENHALSQFSCRKHSWLGYLIKDAHLHDEKT